MNTAFIKVASNLYPKLIATNPLGMYLCPFSNSS